MSRPYRDAFGASSATNKAGWNYKKQRTNGNWKRELWKDSDAALKYRSNNSGAFALTTPSAPDDGSVNFIPMIFDGAANPFWTIGGGTVQMDTGTAPTFAAKLFIRGGISTFVFTNLTVRPIFLRTWRCRSTVNGSVPTAAFTVAQGWDPSLPNPALPVTSLERDVWKNYKFWGNVDTLVETGKSIERTAKIRASRVDMDAHVNGRSRDFWVFYVQNPWDGTTVTAGVTVSHNLTFTGDRLT